MGLPLPDHPHPLIGMLVTLAPVREGLLTCQITDGDDQCRACPLPARPADAAGRPCSIRDLAVEAQREAVALKAVPGDTP